MIDAIILRFDAPLLSFGGVVIDNNGITRMFPARSMLAGMLGSALGYDHRAAAALRALQERIEYAVRCDRPGEFLRDFQTVDLSQAFLWEGWTTRGRVQERAGEAGQEIKSLKRAAARGEPAPRTRKTTAIRYRDYLADAVYTVALALESPEADPGAARLEAALREPARPLFIGRKPCMPAEPIFLARFEAHDLRDALVRAPLSARAPAKQRLRAWFAADGAHVSGALPMSGDRDWTNQIHVGRRFIREEFIDV
ncbi:MAG TPA: type I-E CRISPR-associated protein Cas5/CasD [Candidatus Binataceae bacterium]|nr:type I-E CRISPR-associated protein Cas5/CasD [Candidatus Binataceae bacterium]